MNAISTLPAKIAPASGLFGKGKALVKFYKSGIKNVWDNRRVAAEVRNKYNAASGLAISQSIVENTHLAQIEGSIRHTPSHSIQVTRSELLTVLRTERDFYKLPMFCVVFAVCFEMTPAVLWVFPRIAPSTCYSVANRKRRHELYTQGMQQIHTASEGIDGSESVYRLPSRTLRQLAKTLDFGWPFRYAPLSVLRGRMMKHITETRADDTLLRQNRSQIQDLVEEELHRALMARGLPLDGGSDALEKWLDGFVEPMDAGYFAKPNH